MNLFAQILVRAAVSVYAIPAASRGERAECCAREECITMKTTSAAAAGRCNWVLTGNCIISGCTA